MKTQNIDLNESWSRREFIPTTAKDLAGTTVGAKGAIMNYRRTAYYLIPNYT
jgi:hypothetical protein